MASMTSVEAFYLYGAFAGVVLWGGVSFYLFRSAKKASWKSLRRGFRPTFLIVKRNLGQCR